MFWYSVLRTLLLVEVCTQIADVHTHQEVFPVALLVERNFLTSGHPGIRVGNESKKFRRNRLCLGCLLLHIEHFGLAKISNRKLSQRRT